MSDRKAHIDYDDTKELFNIAEKGLNEIITDTEETIETYNNAYTILEDIDKRFMEETKLNKTDVAFLMFATALQIGRWIIIKSVNDAWSKQINESRIDHDDKSIKDMEKEKRNEYKQKHIDDAHTKSKKHRDWSNIIFDSVPYDITKGSRLFNVSMEGGFHRIHTLGHDPLLGWIYGTMNILSDTITLEDFRTFNVDMINKPKKWTGISNQFAALTDAIDSIKEDEKRFPAAVFAQGLHLASDKYTKLGLPVPVLETFAPDFAGKIYKEGYDTLMLVKDVKVIGIQAVASIFINMLIAVVHGLFYDPKVYTNKDLYEIKTRRILSISNVIASSSNIIWVGGNALAGNENAIKDLDVGGLIVTMYRLVRDHRFIQKVKEEYLQEQWTKRVLGEEYSFISEVKNMGKKDIEKGIAIQAAADAKKQQKVADGLKEHAKVLNEIKTMVIDKSSKDLFGLTSDKKPSDLGKVEQRALCSAIYTLLSDCGHNNDYQREFFLNLENCLSIKDRKAGFDFTKLNNVDSHIDRLVIIKTVCTFLALGDENLSFANYEDFTWIKEIVSSTELGKICDEIKNEIDAVGIKNIAESYFVEPVHEETIEEDIVIETSPVKHDYSAINECVSSYIDNDKEFGKRISDSKQVWSELHKQYPLLSMRTVLAATKIGNGIMVFTTYAVYFKTGSYKNAKYIKIPYNKILAKEFAMANGKTKDTRKLIVSYLDEQGDKQTVSIDDAKVKEESLKDMLLDISKLNGQYAPTDDVIRLMDLSENERKLLISILCYISKEDKRNLAGAYSIASAMGIRDSWNDSVDYIKTHDDYISAIAKFIGDIPYPSEHYIMSSAVSTAAQANNICNEIEEKDRSVMTVTAESLIKEIGKSSLEEKEIEALIKHAPKRFFDYDGAKELLLYNINPDTKYIQDIVNGLSVLVENYDAQEEKKAPAIIRRAGERVLEGLQERNPFAKKAKFELNVFPPTFSKLNKPLPSYIPKPNVGCGIHTSAASGLLMSWIVKPEDAMIYDDLPGLITYLHNNIDDRSGIVEANNGVTDQNNYKYIYSIMKMNTATPNMPIAEVHYTLNMNVKVGNKDYFINGDFTEEGMTGGRDSVIYATLLSKGIISDMKEWTKDPYDNQFNKGFRMNLSENKDYDEMFPNHPLSVLRNYIKWVIENN